MKNWEISDNVGLTVFVLVFFLLNSVFIIWLIERRFLIEYNGLIHQKGEKL